MKGPDVTPLPKKHATRPSALVFVLPDDCHSVSGGNLYNRCLIEALRRKSVAVDVLSQAEARARIGSRAPGFFLVDSLLLPNLLALTANTGPDQHVFLLTHYLPSLEPRQASSITVAREQQLLRGLAGFVVTSDFMGSQLAHRRNEHRPILVVPPALVVDPCREELASRKRNARFFHGLIVANLSPVKGIREFLQGLAVLLSEDDRFAIEIAGRLDLDPDYAQACQRLVAQSERLSRYVHFRGALGTDALRETYGRCTVFISASEMESYGMALHEARAFGLPVLAVDAGNARAHVPSAKHGVLFPSARDLAQGCVALMRDPGMLSRLGNNAFEYRRKDRSSWEDVAGSLLNQLASWSQPP